MPRFILLLAQYRTTGPPGLGRFITETHEDSDADASQGRNNSLQGRCGEVEGGKQRAASSREYNRKTLLRINTQHTVFSLLNTVSSSQRSVWISPFWQIYHRLGPFTGFLMRSRRQEDGYRTVLSDSNRNRVRKHTVWQSLVMTFAFFLEVYQILQGETVGVSISI